MNALNISRLNAIAPYTIWSTIDGIYCFKTDYDVVYRIRIEDDHTIWQEGAYEFSIINESKKNSPNDKKVRNTVSYIIEEFFECNPDILLYQCETGDNKQAARDRLFIKWFKEYAGSDKYFIKASKIVAEGIENYSAIIVQKSNPNLDTIISDFDNFVGFFTNKPE